MGLEIDRDHFEAVDYENFRERLGDGIECSREMFRVNAGILETCHDFIPIMMTTKPEIARSDCHFYAARESSAVR